MWKWLFGTWEVVDTQKGTVEYSSFLFQGRSKEDVVFTLEKNTKSGKERAFAETMSGSREKVSIHIFKQLGK